MRPCLAAVFSALFAAQLGQAAVCTPTAATLCVGIDDIADVWINGTCVAACAGDFVYVDGILPAPITCLSIPTAILSATGANYIAVRVRNTAPTEMWGTWSFDITCSNGGHSYATSNDAFEFFHDPSGVSPPPVLGGYNWYEPAYAPAPAWGAPSVVTGSVFGKRAVDPQTGIVLPPMSWNSSGSGTATNVMYFRQGFSLTPQPTPVPPSFSLSLSATTSACYLQNGVPYNMNLLVCNSGGLVTSPVSVTVTLDAQLSFCGPYSPAGPPTIVNSGQNVVFSWPTFPAGTCVSVAFCFIDYYIGPGDACLMTNNSASLTFNSIASNASFPVLENCCVSPTITPTHSSTPLATPSFSETPYVSPTASPTPSPSASNSPTPSATPTLSPSPTGSPTRTLTPSASPSPTASPTRTATPTATPSSTATATATRTPSATPSPSATQTFSPGPTATVTPCFTVSPTSPPTPVPPTPVYPLILSPLPASPNPGTGLGLYIAFRLSVEADVTIKVFTVAGELVRTLDPFSGKRGANEQFWDAKNSAGASVSSGVFITRIQARSSRGEDQEVWGKAAVVR